MFQKQSFRKNIKIIITIDDKIRNEKLQYNVKREAAKMSVLSSGKSVSFRQRNTTFWLK